MWLRPLVDRAICAVGDAMHSIVGLSRLGARRPAVMSLNTGSIEVSRPARLSSRS